MAGTMRAVLMNGVGPPECLYIGNTMKPVLSGTYDVLIRVSHTALNRADTLQRRGMYPVPPGASEVLGLEAVGEVAESCSSKWKVGDKVMALLDGGGYAEYALARSSECMHVPKNLSSEKAACIPEAWLTAYQLLHFVAKVKTTDRLLIMAGASGVGTACIQLARMYGLKEIVTTSSDGKKALCERLGATKTLGRNEPLTGVFDAVLDPVAGASLPERLKICTLDSRYVLYAAMGGIKCELNTGVLLAKRITLLSSTLRNRSPEYKAELCARLTEEVLPQMGTSLEPIHDSTFSFEEVVQAHQRMDSSVNAGKIVLSLS